MHTGILRYKSSYFQFSHFGRGPQTAVCFHGYGENASSFSFLERHIAAEFHCISINLPFHGQTLWNEPVPFTPKELMRVIEEILRCLNLSPEKFLLLGYSMGGRIALGLAEAYPQMISRLCLIAPDGLMLNNWYWFSTQTWMGNRFFKFTMFNPAWFKVLLKIANYFHLVNPGILKFTRQYIDNPDIRKQLYERWTAMRKFKPRLPNLQEKINHCQLPVRMLFGRYDRIILYRHGERFTAAIKNTGHITILNEGHQLLNEKNADAIIEMIQS